MKKLLLLFVITLTSVTSSFATHLVTADITYTHIIGNDYEVTLNVYRDCSGVNLPTTSSDVTFQSASCGQNFTQALPWISASNVSQTFGNQTTTCNGGIIPGVEQFVYRGIVTLAPCSDWIMHWNSTARNPSINNLTNPLASSFYVQNTLNNVVGLTNNSPQFFNLPTSYIAVNDLTLYNHGAYDIDGDSLHYSLATPLTTPGPPGTPLIFSPGYSQAQPILTSGGFNFNQLTGDMCFTPLTPQIVVVSTLIEEFRNGVLIGSQIRELFLIADLIVNQTPNTGVTNLCGGTGIFTIPSSGPSVTQTAANAITMCSNDNICLQINPIDPDGNNIDISSNIAITIPGALLTIINNNTPAPIVNICWTPTSSDQGLNQFYIDITDDACPIVGNNIYRYDINVLAGIYAGLDQVICGTQDAQLNVSGGAGYTWFDATTNIQVPVGPEFSCNPCSNPIASPSVTTAYYVLSSLSTPCGNTDSVTVTVAADFAADVIGDSILCNFSTAQLDVNILSGPIGTYTYLWNNAGTLSDPNIKNPIASTTTSTWYTPTITSPQGCTKVIDSAFVEIIQIPTTNQNLSICQGDSILIAGLYQNTAGTYYDSLQSIYGCDSIVSSTLSLLSFSSSYTVIDNGIGNYSFTNTSTGNYTLSDWNFGDGTTSSLTNPNHTFATNGTYTVVLAISDSSVLTGISCIEYYIDTITVTNASNTLQCNAGFVLYPDSANANILVINNSIGNTLTYLWDFGDGTTSTLQNPTHTYSGAGPYQLCVTIDDGNGCVDTFCDSAMVNGVAFKAGGFTVNVISTPISTGVNSLVSTEDFSIQPNPNNGIFTIYKTSDFNNEAEVKIFDISSRIINEVKISANNEKIDINIQEYRTGVYFIQIITANKTTVKRIVKN